MVRQPSPLAIALDAQLGAAARGGHVSDHQKAVVLARVDLGKHHREFGYANLVDYADERFGLSPRQTRDLLRIGKKLPGLPLLDQAMADGRLGWTKALEVVKVGTAENEADWIELARTAPSRVLERAVRASGKGGAPPSELDLDRVPEIEVLTFRLSAAEADMVRTTLQYVRTLCGPGTEPLDDGPLLAMLLQRVMADAVPETAPSPERHRFVVENRSDGCETHVGEAACDAEVVEMGTGPERGHSSRTVPPTKRRSVLHRDRFRCQVPGCSNRLWLDIHHVVPRELGGSNAETNLVATCCVHHRLIHDNYLMVQAEGGGLRFSFPDGRRVLVDGHRVTCRTVPEGEPSRLPGRSTPPLGP